MKVKLLLQEELLGTLPANKDLFGTFVASKAPDDDKRREELENAEFIEETRGTVFHKKDGNPFVYDYQIKGFFKEAAGAVNRFDKEFRGDLDKLSAHLEKILHCVQVFPRMIPITLPPDGKIGECQRPLLGKTQQGKRSTIAVSETVPAGSTIEFEVLLLSSSLERYVQVWLDHGKFVGLGQWRGASKGRFTWAQIDG